MSLELSTRLRGAADRASAVALVSPWAGISATAPYGWLFCNGQNVSRTTYAALFAALAKSATVTITIATPGVVSWTAHGLGAGDPVVFRTTGALPTGLTAGTVYYVISAGLTANAFEVAATPGGAAINTSGSQSGVHTGWYAPFGDGNGSTTFGIPDLRGRVIAGMDDMGAVSANRLTGLTNGIDGDILGGTGGEEAHTPTLAETFQHSHSHSHGPSGGNSFRTNQAAGGITFATAAGNNANVTATTTTDATTAGSSTAFNIVQPTIILNYLIFTGV